MIARLKGKFVELNGKVAVVDVNGLGYGVYVSGELAGSLAVGEDLIIYVYEHIREQEHSLYGFATVADKQLFEQLLSVNGVGPKAALAIFDLSSAEKLRAEIGSGNVAFLKQASGVGKKAAERVVVDLQDKVGNFENLHATGSAGMSADDEALAGLIALGYGRDQALQMLSGIKADKTEDRIKLALKSASR